MRKENADVSIVRLYNCPYFINGECSLRSHNNPLIDYWNNKYLVDGIIPHCPKNRAYCHVDVDTDRWSKGTLETIRILIKGWCRNGNGNASEIVEIVEQILERHDDMKDSSLESLIVSRKWFDEKQAEARQEGREEAWDLARRIATYGAEGAYTFKDVRNVFCTNTLTKVFNTPVEEALDKDKKHQEEKKELHVGDEVEFTGFANSLMRGYVMNLNAPGDRCVVILYKMGSYHRRPNECIKTGKHNLDIEKVMASFEKGEEDGDI